MVDGDGGVGGSNDKPRERTNGGFVAVFRYTDGLPAMVEVQLLTVYWILVHRVSDSTLTLRKRAVAGLYQIKLAGPYEGRVRRRYPYVVLVSSWDFGSQHLGLWD